MQEDNYQVREETIENYEIFVELKAGVKHR